MSVYKLTLTELILLAVLSNTVSTICVADAVKIGRQQRELLNIRQKINPDVRGLFNAKRDHYTSVYGRLSFPREGDKRIIAEQFLNRRSALLNLKAFSPNFKLIRTFPATRGGPTYFIYQQHYNNVPISGAVLSIAVSEDGVVRSVNTTHSSALPADLSIIPKYTEKDAKELIKNVMPDAVDWKNKGLFVYFDNKTNMWHLVWNFKLKESNKSWNHWQFLIDAHTNKVIDQISLTSFSIKDCNPQTEEWVDNTSGVSPSPTKEAPVCKDNNEYLLYTGPFYNPAAFATYEVEEDIYNLETYPASSWPPKDINDVLGVKAHSILNDVLFFFDNSYGQKSWASCDDKLCPVHLLMHPPDSPALKGYNGLYTGDGFINLETDLASINYRIIGHELTHAIVEGYNSIFDSFSTTYCDESHPESQGLEEGLADSFGCLVNYFYNKSWNLSCQDSGYSFYQDHLNLLVQPSDAKDCGAHEFGSIVTDFTTVIIYGSKIKTDSGEYAFANLDTANLFTHDEAGWLLIETIRSKPAWQEDAVAFANAVLSTCMEFPESLYKDKCKNVERAFLMKGIDPDVGYGASLVDAYKLPLHVDLSLAQPLISNIQNKENPVSRFIGGDNKPKGTNNLPYIEITLKANVTVESDEKILPAVEKINSRGNISVSYDIEAGKYSTNNSLTTNIIGFWEDEDIIKDGFSGDIETTLILEDNDAPWFGSSKKIYGPLIDYPETFLMSVQPTTYNTEYEPVDEDQSNNIAQFELGVNFAPMYDSVQISADPVGGDPFWCNPNGIKWKIAKMLGLSTFKKCYYEWDVTLSAMNIGNKPAYPVVRGDIIPSSKFSDLDGKKMYQRTTKLEKWKQDIGEWKKNGQLELGGCLPAPNSIVLPGESFCVKKMKVIAKEDEPVYFIIDGDDRVPELSEIDNTIITPLSFTIGSPCVSVGPKCSGYFYLKTKESLLGLKDLEEIFGKKLYEVPPEIKYIYGETDGVTDPLFNLGERVMQPPDKEGNYSSDAFLDPYEDNSKTFKTLMQSENPKKY